MTPMKSRLSVYLDPALMRQLAELAERKKKSMSLIAETAIISLLTPDEADRREAAVVRRLDRLTRQVERLERDLAISVEATALFIRYWLMITPSIPNDFQAFAQTKGPERFASFLQMLGQRLATGQRVFQEVSADITFDASARSQK
jgi:hypothetical protein